MKFQKTFQEVKKNTVLYVLIQNQNKTFFYLLKIIIQTEKLIQQHLRILQLESQHDFYIDYLHREGIQK